MSETCRNGNCARLANRMVRLDNVGDRALCDPCIKSLTDLGMGMRVLEETPESVPEWRKRSLAKAYIS